MNETTTEQTMQLTITLDLLASIGACLSARRKFAETFGEQGTPSARDVMAVLAEQSRCDWFFWLGANLKGFIDAVGDFRVGDFACVVGGSLEISAGCALASGSATVEASGSATVEAYDSATVRASGSATVEAYDSATVRAYDSATVEAYDSATVLLFKFSINVKFTILSLMACVVDRRNARPQLLLAAEDDLGEE